MNRPNSTDAPYDDTTERQIVALEVVANRPVAHPQEVTEAIGAHLDTLFAAGADGQTLDEIQRGVVDLVTTAAEQHSALKTGLTLARKLQQQRDATRQTLDNLKAAIKYADTSVPEIENLWTTIEECVLDDMDLDEMAVDYIANQAWFTSPLEFEEAANLVYILIDGNNLPQSSPLWSELRDWIRRATGEEVQA